VAGGSEKRDWQAHFRRLRRRGIVARGRPGAARFLRSQGPGPFPLRASPSGGTNGLAATSDGRVLSGKIHVGFAVPASPPRPTAPTDGVVCADTPAVLRHPIRLSVRGHPPDVTPFVRPPPRPAPTICLGPAPKKRTRREGRRLDAHKGSWAARAAKNEYLPGCARARRPCSRPSWRPLSRWSPVGAPRGVVPPVFRRAGVLRGAGSAPLPSSRRAPGLGAPKKSAAGRRARPRRRSGSGSVA
jgi:hypothetical protein